MILSGGNPAEPTLSVLQAYFFLLSFVICNQLVRSSWRYNYMINFNLYL
jgi:hypothetical protein